MAVWSRLQALVFGGAIGSSSRAAVDPIIEPARQRAWSRNKNRILGPNEVAQLVAQVLLDPATAYDEAGRNGFMQDRVDALIQLALRAPPLAEVLTLWRRGRFGPPDPSNPPEQVTHALAKEQIEAQYWPAVLDLFFERLSAQDVAVMIQRSILPNSTILPDQPSPEGSNVPILPHPNIDPIAEAQSQGYDQERLGALARIIGLPASPDLAARMMFRGIINEPAFYLAGLEGNTRGEWLPFLKDGFREILTAHDYAELELRGYYKRPERLANTAKHGMSEQDSDWLYDVLGRGLSLRAAFIAERRGGIFQGPTDQIPEWALWQLERGNLKPDVYNLAWAARETLPSAFVIRALLKDGALTVAEGESLLLKSGWPEDLAKLVADHYGPGGPGHTAPKADTHLRSAVTTTVTAIRKAYVAGQVTVAEADTYLQEAEAATTLTGVWDVLRTVESLPPPTPQPVVP